MHTLGPWVVCINSLNQMITVEQDAQEHEEAVTVVDCVADMGDGLDREIGLANARLIAAAPDMLESLRQAEQCLRWAAQEADGRIKKEIVGGWIHYADIAKASIQKAMGH